MTFAETLWPGGRRIASLMALALITATFGTGGDIRHANAQSCSDQLNACQAAANETGDGVLAVLKACKAVRSCRQDCRGEKFSDVKDCREDKRDCRGDCRKKFGTGKDFRSCAASCRQDKRGCKQDARQEKRDCRQVCRDTFLTPECQKARVRVLTSGLKGTASCAQFAACAKGGK